MQWGQPLLGPEVVAAVALLGGGVGHQEEYLPEKGVYDSVEIFFSITLHYYTSSMMNVWLEQSISWISKVKQSPQ